MPAGRWEKSLAVAYLGSTAVTASAWLRVLCKLLNLLGDMWHGFPCWWNGAVPSSLLSLGRTLQEGPSVRGPSQADMPLGTKSTSRGHQLDP